MTVTLLVLFGTVSLAMALQAVGHTRRVHSVLGPGPVRKHLPKMISALIISVQFSELLKVMDHVSITHLVGALFLLVVMLATKAGTEGEFMS